MKIKTFIKTKEIAALETDNLDLAIDFMARALDSVSPFQVTHILITDDTKDHVMVLSEFNFYIDGDNYSDFCELPISEIKDILYAHLEG